MTAELGHLAGRTIDRRYVLRKVVGSGGFGTVFASDQHLLGLPVRRVAIKVSKVTGVALDDARELFADAFLLARAMDGIVDAQARSHLVHVYDLGIAVEHDSRCYVVMEFVEGTTLAAQMASYGRVPAPLAITWVRQACVALAALHRLDPPVLHRDIKPENMLLGKDLTVRLVDFGLAAKLLSCGFAPGTAGTAGYMAPETVRGVSVPASDVYSLGVVLYEALTGEPPFADLLPPPGVPAALHSDWIYEHQRAFKPAPPSRRSNTATRALDELVLSCLAFDAPRRFANAHELLEALDGLSADGEPQARASAEAVRSRRLAGDVEGARDALDDALRRPGLKPAERFALLRELGDTLVAGGRYDEAGQRLVEAWKLTRTSAILRTRADRERLLSDISGAMTRAGNAYLAGRYARLAEAEICEARHA